MRDKLVVKDHAAVLLSRPRIQGLLAALIDKNCTMSDLVSKSGMSYSLLSHHLRRMVALGLVRVAGRSARAGRASVLYRATARRFFIPAAHCRELPDVRLMRDLREGLERFRGVTGLLLWSEDGPRMRLLLDDSRADVHELWMRLRLSSAEARAFNQELKSLFERWRERQSGAGFNYLVHGACVRAPDA